MTRSRKWQSGNADLISVAVSMVILSIAVAGTSAGLIYGRSILARQEHYKAVAYLLRGEMEKKQWELVGVIKPTDDRAFTSVVSTVTLNLPTERGLGTQLVEVTLVQYPIQKHFDTSNILDYYYLTMSANWSEPDMFGGSNGNNIQNRQITFTTAVARRGV